jgi:hypothetical protein
LIFNERTHLFHEVHHTTMVSTVSSQENKKNQQERLKIMMALALEQHQTTDCPDVEELAAWHENKLTPLERENIASHLSMCSECYELWMDIAEPIMELVAEKERTVPVKSREEAGFSISDWFSQLFRSPWTYGTGFGGALAAVMVVLVVLPGLRMEGLTHSVTTGLQALPANMSGSLLQRSETGNSKFITKSMDLFAEPEAESVWQPKSSAERVFAVGVREALLALDEISDEDQSLLEQLPSSVGSKPEHISKKQWVRYSTALVAAGRWTVLMRMTCNEKQSASPEFWPQQEKNLRVLVKEIGAWSADDRISKFFKSWQELPGDKKDYCGKSAMLLDLIFGES